MFQYLVFVGAVIQFGGILDYIRDTLRGTTKPNRITWLMWALAPLIAAGAAVSANVGWAVLPVFMAGFGPLLVFIASFTNNQAYWKLEPIDYICGIFSVLALVFWAIIQEPLIAIIFAIAADGFAALPTLKKAWQHPESETVTPFITATISVLLSFFALVDFNAIELSFPIYILVMNVLLIFAIKKSLFKRLVS